MHLVKETLYNNHGVEITQEDAPFQYIYRWKTEHEESAGFDSPALAMFDYILQKMKTVIER